MSEQYKIPRQKKEPKYLLTNNASCGDRGRLWDTVLLAHPDDSGMEASVNTEQGDSAAPSSVEYTYCTRHSSLCRVDRLDSSTPASSLPQHLTD